LTQKAVGTAKKTQNRLGNYGFGLLVSPHMENVPASPLAASKRATMSQKALERPVSGLNPAKRPCGAATSEEKGQKVEEMGVKEGVMELKEEEDDDDEEEGEERF
jgi:hypothetical protein